VTGAAGAAAAPDTTAPAEIEALVARMQAERAAGRLDAALAACEAAVARQPDRADWQVERGNLLRALGRPDLAVAALEHALRLDPGHPAAHNDLGALWLAAGDPARALACFTACLRLAPDHPDPLLNCGLALSALHRPAEALAMYEASLARRPGAAAGHFNRGNALVALDRLEEAVASYDAALALAPDDLSARINRSVALKTLGRYAESVAGYQAVIARAPDHANAHTFLGICHLLFGNLRDGWAEYEWRWKSASFPVVKRNFPQPQWRGEPLEGRTLLLHTEQGLGDTIQFCRYVRPVVERGGRVLLEVEPGLIGLLGGEGVAQLIPKGQPLPAFDLHCPLLSLPGVFGTDLASIPAPPRYLASDPARRAHWAARLGPADRPRVGLVWSGSPRHVNDAKRSVRLADFAPLLDAPCRFVSLHQEVRAADRSLLASLPRIRHFGPDLADFTETAALVDQLDLVITVDTALAHLAGALGRPVWVLIPAAPDWRWLLGRADTPWYPTMRLYRRGRGEPWAAVISRLRADFGLWLAGGAGRVMTAGQARAWP